MRVGLVVMLLAIAASIGLAFKDQVGLNLKNYTSRLKLRQLAARIKVTRHTLGPVMLVVFVYMLCLFLVTDNLLRRRPGNKNGPGYIEWDHPNDKAGWEDNQAEDRLDACQSMIGPIVLVTIWPQTSH